MSLYLYTKQLIRNLEKTKFKYQIDLPCDDFVVASNKKTKLYFSQTNEENLKYFILTNYDVKVDDFFWDYNFCNSENLKKDLPDVDMADIEKYNVGKLITKIYMMKILANCFVVEDKREDLDKINIEKEIFRDFLINLDYKLPLTDGYFDLIVKVFCDKKYTREIISYNQIDDIIIFLFKDEIRFKPDEITNILEKVKIKNFSAASYYITSNENINQFNKLQYINIIINNQSSLLDEPNKYVISADNKDEYAGFNLLDIDIEKKNIDVYLNTVKNFIDSGGSINFDIINDKFLDQKIKRKSLFIKNSL